MLYDAFSGAYKDRYYDGSFREPYAVTQFQAWYESRKGKIAVFSHGPLSLLPIKLLNTSADLRPCQILTILGQ